MKKTQRKIPIKGIEYSQNNSLKIRKSYENNDKTV